MKQMTLILNLEGKREIHLDLATDTTREAGHFLRCGRISNGETACVHEFLLVIEQAARCD
jgi:hypothetical protein